MFFLIHKMHYLKNLIVWLIVILKKLNKFMYKYIRTKIIKLTDLVIYFINRSYNKNGPK